MKRLILSLILGAAATLGASEYKKIYISPDSVVVSSKGIFVSFAGETTPVLAVHSDERGVYVHEWEYKWNCAECKKPNPIWFSFCAWCGKPKPQPKD
jgi:hypothetical protein